MPDKILSTVEDFDFFMRELDSPDYPKGLIQYVAFKTPGFNNASRGDIISFINNVSRELQTRGKVNLLSTKFVGDDILFEIRKQGSGF